MITGEWGDCDFDNVQCQSLPPGEVSGDTPPPPESPDLIAPSALQQPDLGDFKPQKLNVKNVPARPPPQRPPSLAPPPPPFRPPSAPLGTRKLPATLDEFLLLLGPRRPPPRPFVQDTKREDDAISKDSEERFSDKEWPRQWYLNRGGGLDMNVEEAWDLGYSGKGITVTILDDGVEWNHPDLKDNYRAEASIDINANDKDPFPRLVNSAKMNRTFYQSSL